MTSSASRSALAFVLLLEVMQGAHGSEAGRVELSSLTSSDDLDSFISLSLYSLVDYRQGLYAVADLQWYKATPISDREFTFRVAAGFTTSGTVAPYLEIGTSLYDLFVIAVDDRSDDDSQPICGDTPGERCKLDFNLKAGIRYHITENYQANVFFQRLKFGNIDNEIEGNFDSFGVGFGYRF